MGEYENSSLKAASKLKSVRENSKENNKAIAIKFAIIMVASTVVGFLVGYGLFVRDAKDTLVDVLGKTAVFLELNTVYFAVVLNILMCIIGFSMFAKAKALYKKWDGEDEDIIDEVERRLFYPMSIASIMMVANYLLFGISMCSGTLRDEYDSKTVFVAFLSIAVLILSAVWELILQGKTVELEKEINPEKRGNILDMKFDKKWHESCDEAQKMISYRASFDTYMVTKYVFMCTWVVTVLSVTVFEKGLFPVILVSGLWLVHTVVYIVSAHKYERNNTTL